MILLFGRLLTEASKRRELRRMRKTMRNKLITFVTVVLLAVAVFNVMPPKSVPLLRGRAYAAGVNQWSGYITAVSDDGEKRHFRYNCGNNPDTWLYKSQFVSMKQVGICGQWALYYAVINY
jgi:hypothetical protein